MRRLQGICAFAFVIACASHDETGSSAQRVVGGYFNEDAGPTVAIFRCNGACAFTPYLNPVEICSGTLIGPNLVLTARHCVAPQVDVDNGVLCSKSTFSTPYPAGNFIATPAKDVNEGGPWFVASEVDVAGQDGDLICGNDLAVLHLRQSYEGATPMVPRITTSPVSGETYSAIGYGDDLDGGIGYRHERDGLVVACVGSGCTLEGLDNAPAVTEGELEGQTGLCGGDSGGPAVDVNGLLFGVTSRADASSCITPIYSRVDSHAAWLQAEAVKAASEGSYELPAWAYTTLPAEAGAADARPDGLVTPPPTNDASVANPARASGGCDVAEPSPHPPANIALCAIIAVLAAASRRRGFMVESGA